MHDKHHLPDVLEVDIDYAIELANNPEFKPNLTDEIPSSAKSIRLYYASVQVANECKDLEKTSKYKKLKWADKLYDLAQKAVDRK